MTLHHIMWNTTTSYHTTPPCGMRQDETTHDCTRQHYIHETTLRHGRSSCAVPCHLVWSSCIILHMRREMGYCSAVVSSRLISSSFVTDKHNISSYHSTIRRNETVRRYAMSHRTLPHPTWHKGRQTKSDQTIQLIAPHHTNTQRYEVRGHDTTPQQIPLHTASHTSRSDTCHLVSSHAIGNAMRCGVVV